MNGALRNKNDDGFSFSELIVPALFGVGIAAATAAALVFIAGAVVYSTADPNSLVTGASLLILGIMSFVAGFAASKKGGSFLSGAIAGAALALVVFLASLISGGHGEIAAPYSYLVRLLGLVVSLLGAYLASRHGKGKRFASSPKLPKIKKR